MYQSFYERYAAFRFAMLIGQFAACTVVYCRDRSPRDIHVGRTLRLSLALEIYKPYRLILLQSQSDTFIRLSSSDENVQ